MKKLFFAFVMGACAIFTLPSCSGNGAATTSDSESETTSSVSDSTAEKKAETPETPAASAAIDKLAGMELTKENANEWVETFNAVMDDMLKLIEAKDEAQAKALGEKLAPIMDKLEASGDLLNEEQTLAMFKKLAEVQDAAEKAGMDL